MARSEQSDSPGKEYDALLREIEELRARLEEAEDTIQAIQTGGVDALIVSGPDGEKVFALEGADYPYRIMMEVMNEGVVTLGADGGILSCNARFAHFVKMPTEQILGKPLTGFVTKDDVAELSAFLKQATEKSGARAATLARADGTTMPVNLSAGAFDVGGLPALCIVFTDMTEHKRAEQVLQEAHDMLEERVAERTQELEATNTALREAEFRYRTVAENTYDFEFWVSPEGRYLYASPSCKRIYGHDTAEFLADATLRARTVHPDDRAVFEQHCAGEEARRIPGGAEFRVVRPDGAIRWVGHVCQPVFDEHSQYLGVRGSNRDITERKQAEAEIHRHVEELKAMNEDLARINRVAVNRELRMIELKKRVNDLCIQAGQPPPYRVDFDTEA